MKRRRGIAAVLGAIVVCVVAAVAWHGEREPEYNGKRLSEWLRIYYANINADILDSMAGEPRRAKHEARDAVQEIGTNAIPFLLKWISTEKPIWTDAALAASNWKAGRWALWPVLRHLHRRGTMPVYGVCGFEILGERATNAVPALARMMRSVNPDNQYPRLIVPGPPSALGWIGKEGLGPVVGYVSDTNNIMRGIVVRFLGGPGVSERLGTNASALVPVLVQGLEGTNVGFAMECAGALVNLKVDDPAVIAALGKALGMGNPNVTVFSAEALKQRGRRAESAMPELLKLRNDSDPRIRRAADEAAREIAPGEMEKQRNF